MAINMEGINLGEVEARFAEMIWERAPIPSGELVKLCREQLNWKKSTTYTVLKKLCDKGIFKNDDGNVSAVITKSEFLAMRSEKFVNDTYDGSLPAFIAAFTQRRPLTEEEIAQIRKVIDQGGRK